MADAISHRGPDGEGFAELAQAERRLQGWLGHRRLKVIDLTPAAAQPMATSDGALALTYNGEIYNFRELRSELSARGHVFRSTGDTEVVLNAFVEWGENMLERLDGMFALAVWDARRGRLLLARDRVGKKPLVYTVQEGRLSFASEVKSLRAAPWLQVGPDLSRLAEFLTFGYPLSPATMWEDVHQVPPASFVAFDGSGLVGPTRYWSALPSPGAGSQAGTPAVAEIAALTRAAVRRRMIADVPLGALLSGGVDSSVVVGLMSQESPEPIHTFSIGFPDEASYDERSYARLVADHFGTRHTEFSVGVDAVALLDRLIWHHDAPFADDSAIPTYLVSQLAREAVTVVLNGDGGDEVFGGYARFSAAALAGAVPDPVGRLARRGARLLPRRHGYYDLRSRLERFFASPGAPLERRYLEWISVFDPGALVELLTHASASAGDPTAPFTRRLEEARGLPALDRLLYANFATYLPDDLAPKMDRMSMAHSLEARSPLLDTALIERLARIPAREKVGLRRVKPILRQALRPLLPDSIWNRRKHGFSAPVGTWLRGELGTVFEDEVLGPAASTAGLLDRSAVRRTWLAHRGGEADHGQRLWTLLTLERWLRRANESGAGATPGADVVTG